MLNSSTVAWWTRWERARSTAIPPRRSSEPWRVACHPVGPGDPSSPFEIPEYDEPEPDVTVVRGADEDYEHRIPNPDDVGLLVEISLTTLDQDRGKKLSCYAKSGIPVYWIINLVERQVEVYTGAGPGGYSSRVDFKSGQVVPFVIDGQPLPAIAVNDILPS